MSSASLIRETGHPKLMLWDNLEGLGGVGGGRRFRMGGTLYTCGRFMLMYGKKHYNIVIILQSKKKKKGKKNPLSEPHTQEISSLLDLELDLGITCFFSS